MTTENLENPIEKKNEAQVIINVQKKKNLPKIACCRYL
jgi:hypothetical protein